MSLIITADELRKMCSAVHPSSAERDSGSLYQTRRAADASRQQRTMCPGEADGKFLKLGRDP
ncbi:PABS domain-containing protein [Psidium guajava]|nr:PABS domain-containing protein [Psidium guajava]